MVDGNQESQVTETVTTEVSPEGTPPQAPAATAVASPGADEKGTATGKTYTQAEWNVMQAQITSAKDREIQESRSALARIAMQQELARAQAIEDQAKAQDQADVEAGVITEHDARQRVVARQTQQQTQQSVAEMQAQGEALGCVLMAQQMGADYGIPAEQLLDGMMEKDAMGRPVVKGTPAQMAQKAAGILRKQRDEAVRKASAKTETYDKGPQAEKVGDSDSYEQSLRSRYPSMYPK